VVVLLPLLAPLLLLFGAVPIWSWELGSVEEPALEAPGKLDELPPELEPELPGMLLLSGVTVVVVVELPDPLLPLLP
jgi:hypothetical protein